MTSCTDDAILAQDMPQALNKVELASKLLEEAAGLSKVKKAMPNMGHWILRCFAGLFFSVLLTFIRIMSL